MNGANGRKQLIRPRQGRMVAGVCAGLGSYFGIDPNLVRLACVVLAIVSAGAFALVYLVAWAIVPEEGEEASIAESYMNRKRHG